MYRAALSEMVRALRRHRPDPLRTRTSSTWARLAWECLPTRSTLGCDCLGEILYFDGIVNDSLGNAVVIPNAICMHEEDYGIALEAHRLPHRATVEVRRSRRLVVSMICTVGNYEYGFFWYLYTDGSIEYEVKLTGVLTTGAFAEGATPKYGVAGRTRHLRPQPPALLQRADGHGGRRPEQLASTRSTRSSTDAELNPYRNAWYTAAPRWSQSESEGSPRLELGHQPVLEDRQSDKTQRAR